MNAKSPAIVATLRACPAQHASVSRERFQEGWAELCREDVTPLLKPTIRHCLTRRNGISWTR